jgi:hypothetical protein
MQGCFDLGDFQIVPRLLLANRGKIFREIRSSVGLTVSIRLAVQLCSSVVKC